MNWKLSWLNYRDESGWQFHPDRASAIEAGKSLLAADREHDLVEVMVTETSDDDRVATIRLRGGNA
jgi:hypothetical protein